VAERKGKKISQHAQKTIQQSPVQILSPETLARQEKYLDIFTAAVLFAFGVYHSILYFGHTVVPISDFPAFFRVGQELLSFKIPSTFKLAPVVGLLQVILSYFLGGQYPNLTAGWLLNAILHPFNLILLWLVARKFLGRTAQWFAILAIINPWVLYLLTEPIVETTYLFFILLTFYFLLNRSNFCYLFASIATMVRYEAAALILAAFIMDLIYRKTKKQRILAFAYSVLAAAPFGIWMLGTILTWGSEDSHYLNVFFTKEYAKGFTESVENRIGIVKHMNLLWQVTFYPLLMPYSDAGQDAADTLWKLSKLFAAAGFFFGALYGLFKKNWNILALLLFFVPYFIVHARYPYPLTRFHDPIFWIALLLCLFGFQSIWNLLNKNSRIPRPIVLLLQGIILIIACMWLVGLLPVLPKLKPVSVTSASVPYVTMAVVFILLAARTYIYKFKDPLHQLAVLAVLCLVIISNQFMLVRMLGNGQTDAEFKQLADWYVANAKPGEKMGLYMAGVVQIFAPKYADNIVGLPKADSPSEFIKACCNENITYVVWATREGLSTDHTGYRKTNLDKTIAILREPKNIGPYEFVAQVGSDRGYVNIFRLQKPANNTQQKPPAN
jgi:hypothetical protein